MSPTAFLEWLAATKFDTFLRGSVWAEPLFEGMHVLTLTLFFGFTVMLDLRLLGVLYKDRPASEVMALLNPWCVWGFVIMIASGMLLFCTDPLTFYATAAFKIKMILLGLAGVNILIFHRNARRRIAQWELGDTPGSVKFAAITSLALWVSIVTAGRLIAYVIKPV